MLSIPDENKRFMKVLEYYKYSGYRLSKEVDSISESKITHIRNGRNKPSIDLINALLIKFPDVSETWLLTGEGSMIKESNDEKGTFIPANSTKEALDSLNKLRKIKGKPNKSRIIHDSELVEAEQFIIPIPGQAGLKKAFFAPDQYIEDHFEKETILVRPKDRAVYHKIEVDGDSMPGIVDQGDWARCIDIPKTEWLEKGTFKPNRVYCLFHRYKGPLFKRITKTFLDSITLSSDNPDKDEYPDEVFDLAEFSKILRVVVVEKRL